MKYVQISFRVRVKNDFDFEYLIEELEDTIWRLCEDVRDVDSWVVKDEE